MWAGDCLQSSGVIIINSTKLIFGLDVSISENKSEDTNWMQTTQDQFQLQQHESTFVKACVCLYVLSCMLSELQNPPQQKVWKGMDFFDFCIVYDGGVVSKLQVLLTPCLCDQNWALVYCSKQRGSQGSRVKKGRLTPEVTNQLFQV